MKVVCHFIGDPSGEQWLCFHCPGCQVVHRVLVRKPEGSKGKLWAWNGSLEQPTLVPTVRLRGCCFVMAAGSLQFLPESKHPLAGQSVQMKPL